jgi:hypothetical protein
MDSGQGKTSVAAEGGGGEEALEEPPDPFDGCPYETVLLALLHRLR